MGFNPIFTDPGNAILKDRLSRVSQNLRNLKLSTAEDYQAQVYSTVNAVLSLGESMTPLVPIGSEGPAVVGDAATNYTILNNDAEDIANELLRIEDAAASLFNLAATSLNQLRQQVREFAFASTKQRYIEDFLNSSQLQSTTATLDFNAGLATNSLLDEQELSPTISIGSNSVGALAAGSSLISLSDGRVDTAMVWNGATIELIFTFPTAQLVNRVKLNLDSYAGLEIDALVTSPDGTLIEDVLADLGVDRILLDGTSGKFSGDVIIDFPPRHTANMRMVIRDRVGDAVIALRALELWQRRYSSTGQLTSNAIKHPDVKVLFTTQQNVFPPFASITHQISYDNVSFAAIQPGSVIALVQSPFYYRAILERSSARFNTSRGPLAQTPLDPVSTANYKVGSTTTVPLGNNIIERTIVVNDVIGPIVLREDPLPNTLQIQEGSVVLNQANSDYTFSNNTISFPVAVTGITISYQTTALGSAAIADREEYYTALLYNVQFEAA